jgi:hypothetical protein
MPAKPTTAHTVDSLRQTAEELSAFAEAIRMVAERMHGAEIATLEITNNDQRVRSIEYADNFANAARKALREAVDLRLVSVPPVAARKRVRSKPATDQK